MPSCRSCPPPSGRLVLISAKIRPATTERSSSGFSMSDEGSACSSRCLINSQRLLCASGSPTGSVIIRDALRVRCDVDEAALSTDRDRARVHPFADCQKSRSAGRAAVSTTSGGPRCTAWTRCDHLQPTRCAATMSPVSCSIIDCAVRAGRQHKVVLVIMSRHFYHFYRTVLDYDLGLAMILISIRATSLTA